MSIETNWVVLTGPPGSGKTTVANLLEKRGYIVSHDVSRNIIQLKINEGETSESVRDNQVKLQTEILNSMLLTENSLKTDNFVFLDYALPDNIAFCEMEKIHVPGVEGSAKKYQYKYVFLFDSLPIVNDQVRNEDSNYQKYIREKLATTYKRLGYKVNTVEVDTPEERVKFIVNIADPANKWLQRTLMKSRR